MTEFLVFFGRRGDKSIVWRPEENPLGVYSGKDGTDACQQAAAYHGVMGAFFAVEGTFWGVTPADAPKQFGQQPRMDEQLAQLINRVEQRLALDTGKAAEPVTEGEAHEEPEPGPEPGAASQL